MISPRSIRMTPNRHATGALAANDTDSMARECDSRLDGIVVLGVFHNSDIDSPGNRRRPGDRVMFRGAALILLQLPSSPRTAWTYEPIVASLWQHRHGLPSVSHCSPNTHVISMPSCGGGEGRNVRGQGERIDFVLHEHEARYRNSSMHSSIRKSPPLATFDRNLPSARPERANHSLSRTWKQLTEKRCGETCRRISGKGALIGCA
jgi:hypothetical protein